MWFSHLMVLGSAGAGHLLLVAGKKRATVWSGPPYRLMVWPMLLHRLVNSRNVMGTLFAACTGCGLSWPDAHALEDAHAHCCHLLLRHSRMLGPTPKASRQVTWPMPSNSRLTLQAP